MEPWSGYFGKDWEVERRRVEREFGKRSDALASLQIEITARNRTEIVGMAYRAGRDFFGHDHFEITSLSASPQLTTMHDQTPVLYTADVTLHELPPDA